MIAAYALSPIDLIPDFIPVLGYLDELPLLPLAIAGVMRMIEPTILAEHRASAAPIGRAARQQSRCGSYYSVVAVGPCASRMVALVVTIAVGTPPFFVLAEPQAAASVSRLAAQSSCLGCGIGGTAAAALFLDWRTWHVAIGTVDAAVALLGFHLMPARFAGVEILAGVGQVTVDLICTAVVTRLAPFDCEHVSLELAFAHSHRSISTCDWLRKASPPSRGKHSRSMENPASNRFSKISVSTLRRSADR